MIIAVQGRKINPAVLYLHFCDVSECVLFLKMQNTLMPKGLIH